MRHEFAPLGREPGALQRRLDLALEERDRLAVAHAGPQRMRFPAAELARACERERKARGRDRRQGIVDRIGLVAFDVADKAQRQVKLLARLPAGAGTPVCGSARPCAMESRQQTGATRDGSCFNSGSPAPEWQTFAEDEHDSRHRRCRWPARQAQARSAGGRPPCGGNAHHIHGGIGAACGRRCRQQDAAPARARIRG